VLNKGSGAKLLRECFLPAGMVQVKAFGQGIASSFFLEKGGKA